MKAQPRHRWPGGVLAGLVLLGVGTTAVAQPGQPPPKLSLRLVVDPAPLAPDGVADLAVEFDLSRPWHMYYPILLDTGLPTTVEWDLPEGFSVEPLRYPPPTIEELAGMEYLALGGRFVAFTKLHIPPDADLSQAVIRVKAGGLACIEQCVLVEAEAELKLADAARHFDRKQFEQDREALMPLLSEAPYLDGGFAAFDPPKVAVGGHGSLVVTLKVRPGLHIQDRDPGIEGLIPTRVFVESVNGIEFDFDRARWPQPHTQTIEGLGTARTHSGEVKIVIPLAITDEKFEPGERTLRVLVHYQACTDAGVCYAPVYAETFAALEVLPAGAVQPPATQAATTQPAAAAKSTGGAGGLSLGTLQIFLMAFLGGVILNVMPCVLPVISLKLLGFVQQADQDRRRIFALGLVYAAGIMASFLVLAILMASFKLAWGGIMQRPGFLITLAVFVFAFALSLLGVFELRLPGSAESAAARAAAKEGYGGAFLHGILTTALATPCTAPVLAPAVGLIAQLPTDVMIAAILTIGLGLATPYVLLSAFPGWLRLLPKPGPWMVVFKQVVGFVLLAVVVWLLSILSGQVESYILLRVLLMLVFVGVACWLLGRIGLDAGWGRTVATWVLVVLVLGGGWQASAWFFRPSRIDWQPWQPGLPEKLAREGRIVYVDFTASWCLTCKTNKRLVLESDEIVQAFRRYDVVPLEADFSRFDPRIQQALRHFGYNGVPLNLIYAPDKPDDPIILPQILTKKLVLEKLRQAAEGRGPIAAAPAGP